MAARLKSPPPLLCAVSSGVREPHAARVSSTPPPLPRARHAQLAGRSFVITALFLLSAEEARAARAAAGRRLCGRRRAPPPSPGGPSQERLKAKTAAAHKTEKGDHKAEKERKDEECRAEEGQGYAAMAAEKAAKPAADVTLQSDEDHLRE